MKVEHVTAVIAFAASIVTFDVILNAPWWLTIIGASSGTFVGWQLGCLFDAIFGNWTDPDKETGSVKFTDFKRQPDGTYYRDDQKPSSGRNYEDFRS